MKKLVNKTETGKQYLSFQLFVAEGKGEVNPLGVKFYNNLINEILSNGKHLSNNFDKA